VENALYNSAADEDIPLCHQGTRSAILKYITTWANDTTSETIFWLYGPAGTGKSTITRSLADSLTRDSQLGASYFFKRGEEDRNGTTLFFPTIASQLIGTIPKFRVLLRKSLENLGKTKVENMALKEQFKRLILTPLSEMPTDKSGIPTGVIIVDALDECEQYEQYDRIFKILSLLSQLRELSTVRLRVFLTSRPAIPIVDAFEELRRKGVTCRSLALHEEFYEDTKADISTFLKSRFATIKTKRRITGPWPDPTDLDRLVSLATNPSPLFIYAATLCRFVDDGKGIKRPTKQLKLWLEECDSNASQLNQIYVPILRQVLLGTDEEGERAAALDSEDRSQLLQILSAIVLLATPLPARCLSALLGIDEDDVNHWLRYLYAVLNVPSNPDAPVRLLHKSFADFLLGQEGTGTADFRVDAEKTHATLALKCIQRMENGLSKDICSVQDPGKSRDKTDKAIIVHHIPPDLEYACLYWVYHLEHSGRCITDRDEVCTFLYTHFLHWLESLSWMRKISEGILAIASLETIALVSLHIVYRKLLN
jgi:NACHT domain